MNTNTHVADWQVRDKRTSAMNLLGKILVVMITVMSIAFLGVAISLFATHKNWKATIDDQKATIADLNTNLETLENQYRQNASNLDLEIETAEQQVRKLERERVALLARNEEVEAQLAELQQERRDTTIAIAATQETNQRLGTENDQFEQDITSTQSAMNNAFDEAVKATSELHEAKFQLELQLERNAQLLEQLQGNF